MKILPAEIQALLETGLLEIRYMLRMDLDAGATGVWSGEYTATVSGVTYSPLYGAMGLSDIPGSTGLSVDQLEVTVGGFTSAINTIINGTDWHQRPAAVFRAYLGLNGQIAYVEPVFAGFMDQVPVQSSDGETFTASLTIESNSRELDRTNGRMRSDADQRGVDSGDMFYSYTAAVAANPDIYWGRNGPSSPFK